MSDLLSLFPSFPISSPAASHLLTSLEDHSVTTADLLTLDALDISRRISSTSGSSVLDIKRLVGDITACIHQDIATTSATTKRAPPGVIRTRDASIDALLGGGIRTQCITEFVGESGAGKTQILLLLTLTAQLPPHLGGLSRPSIYISTEAPLSTRRLLQINATLSSICDYSTPPPPSTDRVFSITCSDLESQEHIIRYQLPVMVEKCNVGLIVIDSVAANFRSEFERPGVKRLKTAASVATLSPPTAAATPAPPGGQMAMRGYDMVRLAQTLRSLAVNHNLAVVVSNQVSDKFSPAPSFFSPSPGDDDDDPMSLDFQSRWFTGCDDQGKIPALGLVWANLVATRIVVRKREDPRTGEWRRGIAVVYSPTAQPSGECPFEIFEGGVRTATPQVFGPVGDGDKEDR